MFPAPFFTSQTCLSEWQKRFIVCILPSLWKLSIWRCEVLNGSRRTSDFSPQWSRLIVGVTLRIIFTKKFSPLANQQINRSIISSSSSNWTVVSFKLSYTMKSDGAEAVCSNCTQFKPASFISNWPSAEWRRSAGTCWCDIASSWQIKHKPSIN